MSSVMLPLPQLATAFVDCWRKLLAVLDAKDGVRHSLALENHPLVGPRHRLPRSLGLPPVWAFAGSLVHLGPGPPQQVPGLPLPWSGGSLIMGLGMNPSL